MRNPRMKNKPAIGIGITAAIAALGLVALASDSARTEKPAAVDAQEYADFMANEALDVQDLAKGAEIQRRAFSRMTPPGLSWVQPMLPLTVPFDAENFEDKFLDELLGEDRNSVAVYPLTLALDPKTRETLIYNAEGKPLAALPSEKTSRTWPEGSDPARVVLRLDLLPAEDVEPYLYVEDRIADSLAAVAEKAAKPARKEAVAKSSLTGGQFGFADARKLTNGNFRLTVTNGPAAAEIYSFTVWHTSSTAVVVWTNDLDEVVVSTNVVWTPVSPPYAGLEGAWEVETTNLLLTNGVGIWEDASATGSARVRFYGATQRADSDEDGLTDGAEIFLHRTDPSLSDTDGDGMPDGWEVTYGLNARSGLDESLVGWWKLDDGAGSNAVNSAQDAYHGELVGFSGTNGYWTEDGFLGGALRFDGIDEWVRIAQVPAMLTGGPFTVSAQVWLDPDCTSAWPEAVSDYEAGTWNGYCLGFNENRAYAMLGPYGWLMDSNALAGRWVWTALEYDGAQMRLYLDGVLSGATSAAFVPATNGFFAIGNGQDDSFGSEFWKGRIDDVRLYRAALGTNGLAGMYDAQADPDGDGLSNLEECGIGSDIHGSNEVVFVYFVDSTNRTPDGRRSSGGETAQFVTWNALQAKAASTIRLKEGFAEFTNSTLPPSDPPKWYLGRETLFEAKGDGYFISYDLVDHYIHSASRFCMKEYDPNGWPYSPSTHVCTGEEYFFNSWESYQFWGHMECEYSYEQPNESLLITTNGVSYGLGRIVPILGTGNLNTCEMPMDDELEIYSHTESYRSNNSNRVFWPGTIDPDAYEREWETLTNEYTDGLLLSYTTSDLDSMADWDGLNWGQRWARDEHRQTPYAETLPTNELCSIHLMATNRASLQLQKLRYRWSLPSVSGVVYRVFWWEKFIPANGGGTSVVQRTVDVYGTGGMVQTPAIDLPPPSAEGCTYPVPMESVLKVEITEPNGNPAGDNQFVFAGLPAMRRCNVPSAGTTHVSGQETNLVWTIDSIPDTILSSSPTPAAGPNVTFTYTGEPAHNSDFVPQRQLILAHSLIPNCQATTNLQFFFGAEYANIHEPAVNWFVYWKQDGVVADLQQFQYESIIPGLTGEYGAYDANADICYISPDAYSWAGHQSYSVTNSTGGVVVIGLDLGADYGPTNRLIAVASVCAHELKHKEIHGWLIADPVDSDSDGIPDAKEIALGLDPNTNDTYNVAGAIDPSYAPYGDGEFLARQAEIYYGAVTPTNDWSSYGCNWR